MNLKVTRDRIRPPRSSARLPALLVRMPITVIAEHKSRVASSKQWHAWVYLIIRNRPVFQSAARRPFGLVGLLGQFFELDLVDLDPQAGTLGERGVAVGVDGPVLLDETRRSD